MCIGQSSLVCSGGARATEDTSSTCSRVSSGPKAVYERSQLELSTRLLSVSELDTLQPTHSPPRPIGKHTAADTAESNNSDVVKRDSRVSSVTDVFYTKPVKVDAVCSNTDKGTCDFRNSDRTLIHRRDSVVLKNRKLTAVPTETVNHMQTVVELNLRRNKLQDFQGLAQYTSLKVLHLASNKLERLDVSVCKISSLEHLFLSDNLLETLPEELGQLVNLKVLRLCQNRLQTIPDTIGECTQLQTLSLGSIFGGNNLTTLPEAMCTLPELVELDISRNDLKSLPYNLGRLPKLSILKAPHNQLKRLPTSIGHLEHLSSLDLAHNLLRTLPAALGSLNKLVMLNVQDNRLTRLPGELSWLASAPSLFISGNPFTNTNTNTNTRTRSQTLTHTQTLYTADYAQNAQQRQHGNTLSFTPSHDTHRASGFINSTTTSSTITSNAFQHVQSEPNARQREYLQDDGYDSEHEQDQEQEQEKEYELSGTESASVLSGDGHTRVPSLREICGELILTQKIPVDCRYVSRDLISYLNLAKSCTGCKQKTFRRDKREVCLKNLHGHAGVPSTVRLCRASCAMSCSPDTLKVALNW